MLDLRFYPFSLQLLHPFTIANNTRTTTPVVFVELLYHSHIGYGEASLPPYLGEDQESVMAFLKQVDLTPFSAPFNVEEILNYVDAVAPKHSAAKAAIDIALHDLVGKLLGKPWFRLLGLNRSDMPLTSMTIGIDTIEKIREKVKEADAFHVLKIKLGHEQDKEIIEAVREITDKPICVDVNQGWKDKHFALEMAHYLNEKNVLFIEQALPKEWLDEAAWFTEHSPLPHIADEAIQRLNDLKNVAAAYDGINIKLMKCSGMFEALKLIQEGRKLNLKILIGCMNESSCANMAAAQLAPLADWVDLDGPFMIRNNPFETPLLENGKILLPDLPGIGVIKK